MKILIGYDGSECADAALDDLTHAGLPATAEAQILSVGEVWPPPPPPSTYEIVEQAREAKSPAELERNYAKRCPAAKEALALAARAKDRVQTNRSGQRASVRSGRATRLYCEWRAVRRSDQLRSRR